MIQANVFEIAAANAAAVTAATGLQIVPMGNSPFAAMSSMTYVAPTQGEQQLSYAAMLQAATADDAAGPSDHSAVIGAMIDEKIPQVANHIAFVHGVVKPAFEKFQENYSTTVGSILNVSPTSDFNIMQVSTPTVLLEDDLIALVSQFADRYAQPPAILGNMPVVSPDVLINAMMVTSANVNEGIRTWIAERSPEWLLAVWEYYFSVPDMNAESRRQFDGGYLGISQQNNYKRMDTALALFLISRGLLDEPLDGANVDLATWRKTMDGISRYAGNQLLNALELTNASRTSDMLILSVADMGRTITVDANLYEAFVAEGGTEKDIIGAALSNRGPSYTKATLLAQGEDFRKIWDNFELISISALEARAAAQLRAAAISNFIYQCDYVDEDEGLFLESTGSGKEQLIARAEKAVSAMCLDDLKCAKTVGLCLIAGIRYAHTPAKCFLEDMFKAEEAGCTSPQEAAGMAGLNYICRHLASLLALTR